MEANGNMKGKKQKRYHERRKSVRKMEKYTVSREDRPERWPVRKKRMSHISSS